MRAHPAAILTAFVMSFALAFASTLVVNAPHVAHAEPWFGWNDARAAEAFADGDLDAEDLIAARLGARHVPGADIHAQSWFSVKAFYAFYPAGRTEIGAIAVLGLALDRIAAGPMHARVEPTAHFAEWPPPAPAPSPPPPASPPAAPLITPRFARACVIAAWRASGLGASDARIDEIIARAHRSAILPESRFRVMRVFNESARTATTVTTDEQRYYDSAGANLWLEARLTWRLDRILYVDDEPTLERVRIERQDARARVASRALDALFLWQRAVLDRRAAVPGSREELEAAIRVGEAEAILDVATAGWFTATKEAHPD